MRFHRRELSWINISGTSANYNTALVKPQIFRPEVKVQGTEEFIAGVERDVQVIEAIRQTLNALELLNLVEVEVRGTHKRLIFINEIDRLRGALRIMGVRNDEQFPWTLPCT